ncbi:DUF551 domain-containing protein [Salmonella enterica]|nr:DUF551 domain-containing protein [Salmonella enterica]EIZ9379240.1 DUF551 domain-containing protein [Salmonella enterica]EKF4018420.1 DUF551 domain-containing protein [Salmonella enterica]
MTIVSIPDDWQTCEKLSDDSYVDNALRELVEDTTGDNGVRVVQAVIRALRDSGLIRTYPDLSQPVDPQISEYEKIMLQAGNSPVIPDGWISCSERMPEQGAYISAVSKHGEYVAGQVIDDWLDLHDGTSFGLDEVYLWMMLPPLLASPQQ